MRGVDMQTDATRCHVSASVAGLITAHLAAVPPEASQSHCFTWVVLGLVRRVAQLNVKAHIQDGVAVLVPRDWGRKRRMEV